MWWCVSGRLRGWGGRRRCENKKKVSDVDVVMRMLCVRGLGWVNVDERGGPLVVVMDEWGGVGWVVVG